MNKAAQSAEIGVLKNDLPLNEVLGILSISGKVYSFQKVFKEKKPQINILQYSDSGNFRATDKVLTLGNNSVTKLSLGKLSYISISPAGKRFAGVLGFGNDFYLGVSSDGFSWKIEEKFSKKIKTAHIVPSFLHKGKKVIYW